MPTVRVKRSSSIGELSEEFREPAVRLLQREVQLEEAFAGGHEALREPQVLERVRGEVGHAVPVAEHLDGSSETGGGELPAEREQGCGCRGSEPVEEVGHRSAAYRRHRGSASSRG